MVPLTMKVPVPFEYVFPHGALCLGVEPVRDFDAKGSNAQARDRDSGELLWSVRVLDLDPEAGRFGSSKEVKVKLVAPYQPVPPASTVPGYPPAVEFTAVTVTPYVDQQRKCAEKCRARLAWSVRAESMTTPTTPVNAAVEGAAVSGNNGKPAAKAAAAV